MALASSGSLSFAQIATEFGGTAPHSLSEYYPLVGQGVTGLPSSGTFNFSHFHGKSKTVVTPTWTVSGYNTSSWAVTGSAYNYDNIYYASFAGQSHITGLIGGSYWRPNPYTTGNTRYSNSGSAVSCGNNGCRYRINISTYTTTWTDTSSWVNVTTTASITG